VTLGSKMGISTLFYLNRYRHFCHKLTSKSTNMTNKAYIFIGIFAILPSLIFCHDDLVIIPSINLKVQATNSVIDTIKPTPDSLNSYLDSLTKPDINNSITSKIFSDTTNLYFESNIDFATSAKDTRSDAQSGTGTLGLKFDKKLIYGKIRFTVFSKNNMITSQPNTDNKIFGSNLLIPSNSSNSISNFSFLLGTKSFYKYEKAIQNTEMFSLKRFGGYCRIALYNTTWVLGETTLPVTTVVLDLNVTYRLLSLRILGDDNGIAHFYGLFGYTNRRLGGDYGLDSNKDLRTQFINTTELGFDGISYGARLEVNNFFGQVNMTQFDGGNINGFSGHQAVITLGFNASLNLKAVELN
jgi:hypothetical protein